MRKNHNKDREYSDYDKSKARVAKLKRDNARLRKIIKNLQNSNTIDEEDLGDEKIDKKENKNKCPKCGEGIINSTILNRPDGKFYYNRCEVCCYKTRLKKYDETVKNGFKK